MKAVTLFTTGPDGMPVGDHQHYTMRDEVAQFLAEAGAPIAFRDGPTPPAPPPGPDVSVLVEAIGGPTPLARTTIRESRLRDSNLVVGIPDRPSSRPGDTLSDSMTGAAHIWDEILNSYVTDAARR